MTHHMTALMQQTIGELLDALEPFEEVSRRFMPTWKRNVEAKHQVGLGKIPTVGDYDTLKHKAQRLRALMGDL